MHLLEDRLAIETIIVPCIAVEGEGAVARKRGNNMPFECGNAGFID